MTEYTAEVVKMEFANLMGTLPTYFETLNTQLAEAFAIDQETNQAFLEWDMITQMETLNTNILDSFTLLNESLTVLSEGFKEYLAEAFAVKDELLQLSMETLITFLSETFAVASELSVVQMEGLLAYLGESFALRDELSTVQMEELRAFLEESFALRDELSIVQMEELRALLEESFALRNELSQIWFGLLIEKLNEFSTLQGGNFESLRAILLNDVAIYFTNLSETMINEFTSLKEALDLDIDDVGTAIETVTDAIDEVKEVLNEIKDWTSSQFFEDVIKKLKDDRPTKFEQESLDVAKDANRLTIYGNELAKMSNALAVASLLIGEASLTLQAMPDIVKMTGAGAAVLLAATAIIGGIALTSDLASAPKTTLTYAEGGIPGYGELFVAREAGPEFVGSFGSRNVVMNNDQIVAAVSGGVYDAVRRANAEQTQQPIYLNVEAKVRENVLFDMMETVKAERGVRLATGGAWYNSIRNGAFHIGAKMPKGEVRQGRTVALATFGQRYPF